MGPDWSSVSRREAEVLQAVREHLTNAEIGARFFISERTVESHVSSLLRKLQVRDRSGLASLVPPGATSETAAPALPGRVEMLIAEPVLGRDAELDELEALWTKARGGHTLLGLVTGEAGVGKSRLVAELAARAHRDGGRVLWSACFEDVQAPYQPFADALEDHAAVLSSAPLADRLGESATVLAAMVGLRPRADAEPSGLNADAAAAVGQLALALRRFLQWLAATAPVLLVVEDLHWAADSTRETLLQLVRSAGSIPLLVVGTSRDTQPDLGDGGEVFLGRCALLPNGHRLRLQGLEQDAVARLLGALGSGADVTQVRDDTGGNPLLVREVAMSNAARGSSLRALLAPRYGRLGPNAIAVLDAAAVIGSSFDATLIAGVLDRPVMDVVEALDEADAAGLVQSIPDRPGRFAFVHPLFRTLHYDTLPTSRRLQLHHHAAIELERAASDDRVLAALARHACAAAPIGDPRAAIRYARAAAAVAERVLALDEAGHHYRQALRVAEILPDDRRLRLDVSVSLGRVLVESADPSGRDVLREAATWARELRDGPTLADIAWSMTPFGRPATPGAADPEFVSIAEDALQLLDAKHEAARARVLAALSAQLSAGGDAKRGAECATESVRIARRVDEPVTLGIALLAQRLAGGLPVRPETRMEISQELVTLGDRLREPTFTLNGLYTEVWARRELGDLDGHGRAIDALEAALAAHPNPTFRLFAVLYRATQEFLAGDLDEAQRLTGEAFQLAPDAAVDSVNFCGPMQTAIMHARGQVGALAPAIEGQLAAQPGFGGAYEGMLAVSYAAAGRDEDARRIVRAACESGFSSLQANMSYTTALALFAEAAELTCEAEAGEKLLDLLEPFSGLVVDNSSSVLETIDLAIAKASLAAGDAARARASAELVLESPAGRSAPVFRARALVRLAAATASAADTLVTEALEIADRTGALVVRRDAEHYGLLTQGAGSGSP